MFANIAYAMGGGGGGAEGQPDMFTSLIPIILIGIIFYFFLIRPQSKRQKEHQSLLSELKRGDEVVTTGGVIGRIHSVTDTVITLEVAQNMRIRVLKGQIAGLHTAESKQQDS
ncbi:MAG: preprotein translocase subunit YajC [Candidatus Lernaella stagnicola]|nr:preprotein translocase subunit YajC [Candidatus Lernaella stagnicola]